MKKTISLVLCIVLLSLSFTACRNSSPIPPWALVPGDDNGNQGIEGITPQKVAEGIDLDQLSKDIASSVNGTHVPGLKTSLSAVDPTQNAAGFKIARNTSRSSVQSVVYITVEFIGGYSQNDGATVVSSGKIILTASGNPGTDSLTLNNYSGKTVEQLAVTTTAGGLVSNDKVEITIPRAAIKGTATFNGTEIAISGTDIEAPEAHTGATITVGNVEVPVDEVSEGVTAGFNGLFAGGYGTEQNPYIIKTTAQFEHLGHSDVQKLFLQGENDNLYFRIENNIDLSDHSGLVGEVFGGHLIGDNITITCSNNMPYLFNYAFEDTTFKDFRVLFGAREKTLVFSYPAVKSLTTTPGTGENDVPSFTYDKPTLTINFDNVDYEASSDNSYRVKDNNFGFYSYGTSPTVYLYDESGYQSVTFYFNGETPDGTALAYTVNIENCDVKGNFYGGFSGSGAAIFAGGQLCGMQLNIKDSSFSGTLEGYNTSLIAANSSSCWLDDGKTQTTINVDNVTGGTIISYSGAGGVIFSNAKYDLAGASAEYKAISPANALSVNGKGNNEKVTITANSSVAGITKYQYKLSLPTLYWYDNGVNKANTGETNSNTFTIEYSAAETAPDVYIAKPITRIEAEALSKAVSEFASLDWENAATSTDGEKYIFVKTSDNTQYLVIDYNDNGLRMYSENGLPSNTNSYGYLKVLIALGLNDSNEVIATSLGETM